MYELVSSFSDDTSHWIIHCDFVRDVAPEKGVCSDYFFAK